MNTTRIEHQISRDTPLQAGDFARPFMGRPGNAYCVGEDLSGKTPTLVDPTFKYDFFRDGESVTPNFDKIRADAHATGREIRDVEDQIRDLQEKKRRLKVVERSHIRDYQNAQTIFPVEWEIVRSRISARSSEITAEIAAKFVSKI